MKQFLIFVKKEWLHILRDRRTLFILFGMPVAQILIFGFALSNEVKNSKIAILDHSNDAVSQYLIQKIEASNYFEIVENLDSDLEIDAVFKKGNVRLVLVFEPAFSEKLLNQHEASIQLISDASDPNVGTTLVNYCSSIINDYQNELLGTTKLPLRIKAEVRMIYNPQLKAAYNFVPGVMAMVLLLICSLMTSVAIVREKELGTMEILLVSPIKPALVIISKTIPYLILSFINICSILLLSYFVLDVPIKGSLVLLLGESTLFIITSLALGMFVSSVTTTQTAAMFGTLVGLFMPTLMFSGFMFPVDNMPVPLQLISNILPSKWFFYIVKSVMIKGLGFYAVWKETLILIGITVFMFVVSIRNFDKRLVL
ncbi:MAG: ABC transporter permease [Saprospiraceae bacterium]|nr:ABC transporter permease [Saprospiraceae bacterium]MBK8449239.1 ABC transporter permease [Saprospiraceae bacterium]MBK9222111.1 ABC transporter permease [Saprospiraceae bacterium]MBK9720980.1 ABC transporter permease [Saprospiraceae bacterium]MBK9727973.1 ABC transporter permease [Saprospiraceae bacterium]